MKDGTFLFKFMRGQASSSEIDSYIDAWHTSESDLPLHTYLGMSEELYAAWVRDASTLEALLRTMKGAPLTVTEARVILRADEALGLTYEARLATGTTFSDQEREAWIALVASANERIAAWEGQQQAAPTDGRVGADAHRDWKRS